MCLFRQETIWHDRTAPEHGVWEICLWLQYLGRFKASLCLAISDHNLIKPNWCWNMWPRQFLDDPSTQEHNTISQFIFCRRRWDTWILEILIGACVLDDDSRGLGMESGWKVHKGALGRAWITGPETLGWTNYSIFCCPVPMLDNKICCVLAPSKWSPINYEKSWF